MIKIYIRDINGTREIWEFDNEELFYSFCLTNEPSEDVYEIQMVVWNGYCIYSGLEGRYNGNGNITFEELTSFFA